MSATKPAEETAEKTFWGRNGQLFASAAPSNRSNSSRHAVLTAKVLVLQLSCVDCMAMCVRPSAM